MFMCSIMDSYFVVGFLLSEIAVIETGAKRKTNHGRLEKTDDLCFEYFHPPRTRRHIPEMFTPFQFMFCHFCGMIMLICHTEGP